jgi:ribosomal protein L25 (general stress protein Ctc)
VAYRADIEIAVRGAQELKRLQNEVSATSKLVDGLNKYLENIGNGGIVRNINNLKDAVGNAAAVFNKAALGTDEATIAAKKYITATNELNAGLRERAELLKQITEQERKARLAAAGVRETTQYAGPIGPGQASPVALSSQLRGRTEQILAERKGRAELNAVLQDQSEKERQLVNSKLDQKAAAVQAVLDKQAAAAEESAAQTKQLADRQAEFTQRTEAAARAARAQTAEFIRQQRLRLQFLQGTSRTFELGPGGPGFSGGYTASQRTQANQQAILKSKAQENAARRETLQLLTREELFELRLNKILERNAAAVEKRTQTRRQVTGATSNALIGGAFPLLFGQGIGASIGGGIGGAVGGVMGGTMGFGLSLVGTALGTAFDTAANSARDFAKALRGSGDAAQVLESLLGGLNPETETLIKNLQSSGQTARAADLAFKELSSTVGKENAKALQDAGNGWDAFGKQVKITLTSVTANVIRTFKEIEKQYPGQGGLVSFIGNIALQGENRPAAPAITPEASQRTKALQQETDLLRTQAALGTVNAKTNLDSYLALSQRAIQQERITKQAAIEFEYSRNLISTKERNLKLTQAQLEAQVGLNALERQRIEELQRRQEEAARKAEEAARKREQVIRNIYGLEAELVQETLRTADADVAIQESFKGSAAAIQESINQLQTRLDIEARLLDIQYQQKVLSADITEKERALAQNIYTAQRASLQDQYTIKLRTLQLDQARLQVARAIQQAAGPRKVQDITQQREGQLGRLRTQTIGLTNPDLQEQLNQRLDQAARRYETLTPLERELSDLQLERSKIQNSASQEDLNMKDDDIKKKQQQIELETQYLTTLDATEAKVLKLQQTYSKYSFIATEISNALSTSITGLITGTTTVAEAFSKMFENIGKAFIDMATQMLAQKLLFTVINALMPSTAAQNFGMPNAAFIPTGGYKFASGGYLSSGFQAFADGGMATRPTLGLVGEGGQPEYIIPAGKMRESMRRYASGTRGSAVIPAGNNTSSPAAAGAPVATPIDVRYSVSRINSVDYVTADQFQQGLQQAAAQGAARGEQSALRRLQQSRATRNRLGLG